MNRKMNRKIEKLATEIKTRLDMLPPEFPEFVKDALTAAELSFRLQGGCADIIEINTTEDGIFLSPMPADIQSFKEIRTHLQSVIEVKPGASSASFAYVGGGSLHCLHMSGLSRFLLHFMVAPITGRRTIGEWSIQEFVKPRASNVMPRVIAALRKCRHSFLSVSAFDNSERTIVLFSGSEYVHAEINGVEAEPEKALEKMVRMVDEAIDGRSDLSITALDEGDCQGGQPKAVWGIGFSGGVMTEVRQIGFADLESLFALADNTE